MRPPILLFASLLLAACQPPTFDAETCTEGAREGDCMAAFELTDQHGDTVRRDDFAGLPLVLIVGEMWCPICSGLGRDREPWWQENGGTAELVMVQAQNWQGGAVSAEEVSFYADDEGFDFGVLADNGPFNRAYRFGNSRPRSYIVDTDGVIAQRIAGRDPESIIAAVEGL